VPLITTTCPTCGEIELPIADVVLRVCDEDQTGACVVVCPTCGARFAKPANDVMMIMLVTFGIDVVVWQRPAEVDERPIEHPPLSPLDMDRFSDALSDGSLEDWLRARPTGDVGSAPRRRSGGEHL